MRCEVHNLLLATGCGLILCGLTAPAEAGYIVTSLAAVQNDTTALAFDKSSSSSSSTPENDKAPPRQKLRDAVPQAGLNAAGSMTSPSLTSSGGSTFAQAAPLHMATPTGGELAYRLACQREHYHPRFIKSRLFRPPRTA